MVDEKSLSPFQSTFTTSIVFVIGFMLVLRFSELNCTHYSTNTFMSLSLLPGQLKEIKILINTFMAITTGVMLVPAVLADCQIDKINILKFMSLLGSVAPCLLLALAFISADFSYSSQYEMKRDLLSSYFSFNVINEIAVAVQWSVLCDQIVNQFDFTLGMSKIFSLYYVSREGVKLIVFAIGNVTADDKLNASYVLLASSFVLIFAVSSFIVAARRKVPLRSHPPNRLTFLHVVGYLLKKTIGQTSKTLCNFNLMAKVRYSDAIQEAGKSFWHLQLTLLCLVPYFYFVDAIALSSIIVAGPRDSENQQHERANARIYGQIITFVSLFVIQFAVFPVFFNCRRRYFDNPLHRLYTYHVIMGGLGVASFYMVLANQRATPETFISESERSIAVHNFLNTTTTLKLEERYVVKNVNIEPYGMHMFIFSRNEPVGVTVVNKFYHMEDYYYLTVNREDAFGVTVFGLEELPMNKNSDRSALKTRSRIIIMCLMAVCRGYVMLECGGTTIRPELFAFGVKAAIEESRGSQCFASLVDFNNEFLDELRFTANDPVNYLAAVENVNTTRLHLLHKEQGVVYTHWSLLPIQVLASIVNCMFWIALSQFLFQEAPKSLQTTTFASSCFYQYLAHIFCAQYLSKNGSYAERNGFFVLGAYVVSFVCFAFVTTTHKRRKTLERLQAAEAAEVRNKSSRLSMASNLSSSLPPIRPSTL